MQQNMFSLTVIKIVHKYLNLVCGIDFEMISN